MTPIAVTPQDAADAAKVCLRTVFQEIRRGRLKAFKVGRTTRIRMADLDAWLGAKPIAPKIEVSDAARPAKHGQASGRRRQRA
jgi:excisionase family DNA binding protein